MVTKQEKQEVCIQSLEQLAVYISKLRNGEFERKRNYISSPHYDILFNLTSKHFLKIVLTAPYVGNCNSGVITLDVIRKESNLIQHRIWLAIEPSSNSDIYFGYSSPFFRGKPKDGCRVGSSSSSISALFAPSLITKGIQSDEILNILYLGLPRLLNQIEQLPDLFFK